MRRFMLAIRIGLRLAIPVSCAALLVGFCLLPAATRALQRTQASLTAREVGVRLAAPRAQGSVAHRAPQHVQSKRDGSRRTDSQPLDGSITNPSRRLQGVVTGAVTAGGSAVTLTIATAGDTGQISFSGALGESLGLGFTNVSLGTSTCCGSLVSVLKPDGSTLQPIGALGTNGLDINLPTLPTTGTYTIIIDPQGNTGSVTLTLSDDATDSVSVGGSSTSISIPRIGQNGRVTFSGTAGEHLGLGLTSVTVGSSTCCSGLVSVLNPDGSTLKSAAGFGTNGVDVNFPTLPTSGTYTIFLDPMLSTGSVTLTLSDDVTGSIVLGDPPATFSVTRVGQNARISFDGLTNQQVQITSSNTMGMGCCDTLLSILRPDGSTVTGPVGLTQSGTTTNATLDTNGSHAVFIEPGLATGTITLSLDDQPETGPLASDQTAETGDDTTSSPGNPQPMSPSGLVSFGSFTSDLWTGSETGTVDGLNVVSSTDSGTFALTGVALDASTGSAIQGATVGLTDSGSTTTSTTTDGSGSFAFINMPSGVYGLSVNGSGYGSYQVLNYNYESDTKSQVTAELDTSSQTYDESANPADSSLSTSSAAVSYNSQTRVPPSIRVAFVNRDSQCNRTSIPSNPVVRNYKWDFYVLHVLGPEVGGLGLNELGVKAFESVVQNYAWYNAIHRFAPGGADVDNSTSFQCFKPEFPVRRDVLRNWRIWLYDVLPTRVAAPGGNLQLTQFRGGSHQVCSGDSEFPADGNVLSQNDLVEMSQNCAYSDWKPIVNYFYTGHVVNGQAPPNPTTSFSRPSGGVALNFVSKVGGSPVGWSYVLQRLSLIHI